MKPLDPRHVPLLRPARTALAVQVGATLLAGLLVVAQASALGWLVVAVVTGEPWRSAAVALALVVVLRAALGLTADLAGARAATRVGHALRGRVLDAARRAGPVALAGHRTGELALLATRGVAAAEPYLVRYLPSLVTAAVVPVAAVAAIAWLDLWSALVVVLTLPLVPLFAVLVGLTTRDHAARQYAALGALAGHFLDVVRGLPTLVAHRRAHAQTRTIADVTDRYRRASADTLRLAFASSAVLELVATISVALVAVLVGLRLAGGGLELQVALTVLLLAPEAYWPLRRVGAEFHAAAEGTATLDAVLALDDRVAPVDAPRLPDPDIARPLPMHLRGLELTWPGRERPAVAGLDVDLPARGLVAVTGASGSGKSTLLAALVGDLAPTAGEVGVVAATGTTAVHDLDRAAWQRRVAWLPQRPWLQPGTIGDNLRLGASDPAHVGEDRLWAALAEVGLAEVVAASPDGLDTPLGEDGSGLSAGQRARLALARVIVAGRPLVVLDEPSAHLDAATEAVVVTVLRRLAQDALVVVVAHRDAVVEAADEVLHLPAPSPSADLPRVTTSGAAPARVRRVADPDPSPVRDRRWRWHAATLLGAGSQLAGVALTATAGWLIVRAAEQPPVLHLMVAVVGVRAFGLARPALRYAERLLSHDLALRLLARRRVRVYDALVPLVPGALDRRRGDLLAQVVDDVDAVVDERLRVRQPVAAAVVVTALTAAVVAALMPAAGAVLLASAAVAGAGAYACGRWGARRAESRAVAQRARLSEQVTELLTDLRDLRLWQADGAARDRALRTGDALAASQERAVAGAAVGRALVPVAVLTAVVACAATGAAALAAGVAPPLVALAVLVPLALADVLAPLADAGALRVRTAAATARLDGLAARIPAVTDPVVAAPTPRGPVALRADRLSGGWGARAAFSGVDLDLPPGRRLGVVGPSGSGKSTLAAVLARFRDPQEGTVALGNTDLRDLRLDAVRRRVLLVDDDPYVFGSTVAENVRLARPEADDDEVAAVLVRAGLGPWVAELPHGLHTRVGDGGAAVSGGERARLGLARALLADPDVLVLDEPTAHLDGPTARAVAADLLAGPRRTLVWITHDGVALDAMDEVLHLGGARPTRKTRGDHGRPGRTVLRGGDQQPEGVPDTGPARRTPTGSSCAEAPGTSAPADGVRLPTPGAGRRTARVR